MHDGNCGSRSQQQRGWEIGAALVPARFFTQRTGPPIAANWPAKLSSQPHLRQQRQQQLLLPPPQPAVLASPPAPGPPPCQARGVASSFGWCSFSMPCHRTARPSPRHGPPPSPERRRLLSAALAVVAATPGRAGFTRRRRDGAAQRGATQPLLSSPARRQPQSHHPAQTQTAMPTRRFCLQVGVWRQG